MKKKLLIHFIIFVFLVNNINVLANYSDTKSTEFEQSVNCLASLGIITGYEDNTFKPERYVTRAEFSVMTARMLGLGMGGISSLTSETFSDVPSAHWAFDAISVCRSLGIVNGYAPETFAPDDNITYAQAIKMLVSTLGYQNVAEHEGGYPSGYITTAQRIGLLKNQSPSYIANATRGDIARLMYQALDVNLPVLGQVEGKMDIAKDETLLTRVFNATKKQGQVTATYEASISESKQFRLRKNNIVIDDTIYETELKGLESLLGYMITYYVRTEGDKSIVIAAMKTRHNDETEILFSDIEDVEDISGGYKIRCISDSSTALLTIPSSIPWVFNGRAIEQSQKSKSVLDISAGKLVFVEHMTDNEKSVLFVHEPQNYVFDGVNVNKNETTIYDKYQKSLRYIENDSRTRVSISKNNQPVAMSEINMWDVLTAYVSFDATIVHIEVSDKVVEGTIEEISEGSTTDMSVVINDQRYYVAPNFLEQTKHTLKAGGFGRYHLDVFGKLAALESNTATTGNYGYLLDFQISTGLNGYVVFKILNDSNKIMKYQASDKIFLTHESDDGKMTSQRLNASDVAKMFVREPNAANPNTVERQLITYELDGNGEISRISLAQKTQSSEEFSLDITDATRYYHSGIFEEKYKVNSSTKVFYIPGYGQEDILNTSGNPYKYFVSGKQYRTLLYDVDDSMTAGAVVIKTSIPEHIYATSINMANSPIVIVDKLTSVLSDNGEQFVCVKGYQDGEYVTLAVSPKLSASEFARDFVKGNIVQYETNYQEVQRAQEEELETQIIMYNVIYKDSTPHGRTYDGRNVVMANSQLATSLGIVSYVDAQTLLKSYGGTDEVPYTIDSGAFICRYDSVKKTIEPVTSREITKGQKIFIRQRYQRVKEIMIID